MHHNLLHLPSIQQVLVHPFSLHVPNSPSPANKPEINMRIQDARKRQIMRFTKTPAPSPKTKPSLSWSQGLEAVRGSLFLLDNALHAPKPANDIGCKEASTPPAIIKSATPSRI
ncbi:hypothetical protein HanPI659440_Chr01g0023151 [Helianthus annuus]|nr:hypothetical protein HanPI659440_Chr01g0023151 [Helianthus annuus]